MKKNLRSLALLCLLSTVAEAQIVDTLKVTAEEKKLVIGMREKKNYLLPSRTTEFKATVLNTNFVVPIIRFNKVNDAGAMNNQRGNVSFFNSIGAGVSINRGRLELTTDETGKVISTEMNNIIGLQVGLLFAANTGSENNANIFAPTLSVSILNFQIGLGYELGTLPVNDSRTFYTIAYAIPIAKLVKGGFYVLRGTRDTDKVKIQDQSQGIQNLTAPNQKRQQESQQKRQQRIEGFY